MNVRAQQKMYRAHSHLELLGLELDEALLGDHGVIQLEASNAVAVDPLSGVEWNAYGPTEPKPSNRLRRVHAQTRLNHDGRTRYRGQPRRGRQTHQRLDGQSIDFAVRAARMAIVRASAGLVDAETRAQVSLAQRFAAEALAR